MQVSMAILDDNKAFLTEFAQQLEEQCKALNVNAEVRAFEQPHAFYNFVKERGGVDIAFVDILLPNENGVKLAAELQREFPQTKLLFITAVAENAADIFEAKPSGFLLKPVSPERLRKALSAVLRELQAEEENSILLQTKGRSYRLRKNDIFYIESNGRQLEVHLVDSVVSVYGEMKEMEALLEGKLFRCHRSYLVNLEHVRQITKLEFTLYTGERVPISRGKQAQARTLFFSRLDGGAEGVLL